MAGLKPTSVNGKSPNPETGRRSFIWKTGAAMSAVVASAVAGVSKTGSHTDSGLQNRIGILEDAEVIRKLHQTYISYLDRGMYEEAVDLFAENGESIFNGGLFSGKEGLRRLYCERFRSGMTGKKIEPAPGFEPEPALQLDTVEVAEDRRTARGRFPYSIEVGAPMTGDSSLVEMARLQGEGIVKWWEGGIYEASYVKTGESWKIRRLEFRAASKADYRPGRTYAKPIDVPAFRSVFPKNPTGPDRLV